MVFKKKVEPFVLVEDNDDPVLTSFTIHKFGNSWHLVKLLTKGDKVIDIEITEHHLRSIAIESFKIESYKQFMGDIV